MKNAKLIYAYDPLCGWCYGIIPAIRHLKANLPDLDIEVLPGGLFTGTPARPYASLIPHITTAEQRLQQVTGRKPKQAFHRLIASASKPDAASEIPCLAVLQMIKRAPDRALEFAHILQEEHYENGKDLNLAETYHAICNDHDFPALNTDEILSASLDHPEIVDAFQKCRALQPSGFPTLVAVDQNNQVIGKIPSTYDPDQLLSQVVQIFAKAA